MSKRNPKTDSLCKGFPKITNDYHKSNNMLEKIYKSIADELDLPVNTVRNAVVSVFKFTSLTLKDSVKGEYAKDKFVRIRWIGLGSFQISKWRVYNYFKNR